MEGTWQCAGLTVGSVLTVGFVLRDHSQRGLRDYMGVPRIKLGSGIKSGLETETRSAACKARTIC